MLFFLHSGGSGFAILLTENALRIVSVWGHSPQKLTGYFIIQEHPFLAPIFCILLVLFLCSNAAIVDSKCMVDCIKI